MYKNVFINCHVRLPLMTALNNKYVVMQLYLFPHRNSVDGLLQWNEQQQQQRGGRGVGLQLKGSSGVQLNKVLVPAEQVGGEGNSARPSQTETPQSKKHKQLFGENRTAQQQQQQQPLDALSLLQSCVEGERVGRQRYVDHRRHTADYSPVTLALLEVCHRPAVTAQVNTDCEKMWNNEFILHISDGTHSVFSLCGIAAILYTNIL